MSTMDMRITFRRFFCLALMVLFGGAVYAQTSIETTAGKLKEQLADKDLTHLIISGEMNANDFAFLRDQSGIKKLDLTGVEIVPGGSYQPMYDKIETRQGVMPGFWLFSSELAKSLTEIILPETVKVLDKRCLQDGALLTSITLPAELDSIHEMALGYCTALKELEIPSSVRSIGSSAFDHCTSLESLELPEDLTFLGQFAFSNCSSLVSMAIPEGIKKLEGGLFKECTALREVEMSPEVVSFGKFCFYKCASLEKIKFPYLLTSLGEYVFEGCTSLTEVEFFNQGLTKIPDNAFKDCLGLELVNIPASVSHIGAFAFSGCTKLKSIILPPALDMVMGGAFARTGIETLFVPSKVRYLSYGAFTHCPNLKRVWLPASLENFGEVVFGGCDKLEEIHVGMLTPLEEEKAQGIVSLVAHSADHELMIYVPQGTLAAYQAAPGWKDLKGLRECKKQQFALSAGKRLASYIAMKGATQSWKDYYEKLGSKASIADLLDVKITGDMTKEDAKFLIELGDAIHKLDLSEVKDPAGALIAFEWSKLPNLSALSLPKSVAEITTEQFMDCRFLETLTIPQVKAIGDDAFYNCQSLRTLPSLEALTEVGERVFFGCASLQEITLPQSIIFITPYMFANCTSLSKVNVGTGMTDIDEWAFFNCSGLKELHLPATLTEIKDNAFFGCTQLGKLTVLATEAPDLGKDVFMPWHFKNTELVLANAEAKATYLEDETWKLFEKISVLNATQEVVTTSATAYGVEGAVVLESAANVPISVYTITGQALLYMPQFVGTTQIRMAAGTYVVRMGAEAFKVNVR